MGCISYRLPVLLVHGPQFESPVPKIFWRIFLRFTSECGFELWARMALPIKRESGIKQTNKHLKYISSWLILEVPSTKWGLLRGWMNCQAVYVWTPQAWSTQVIISSHKSSKKCRTWPPQRRFPWSQPPLKRWVNCSSSAPTSASRCPSR